AADGTLYLGSDGGLFVSTDNAATFSDRLNVGITTHLLYSVSSTAANPDLVLGGMQDNGTRMREGTTTVFRQVIGGDGFGSNINRANGSLMLGSLYNLAIRKSTNGGSSWSSSTAGIAEAGDETNAPFITRIVAWEGLGSTGNEVYTFSNSKIYRSTNYGGDWALIGTPTTTRRPRNTAGAPPPFPHFWRPGATPPRLFFSHTRGPPPPPPPP